jgi:hypothetical protein
MWVHLFRGELHTLATGEKGMRRVVHGGGLMLALWGTRKELFLPCTMTFNNVDWEKGWFYLLNDGADLPPYTRKVPKEKRDAWVHGVLPPVRQRRLKSLTTTLRQLADSGLGVTSVIANFHHWRVIPLMERELRIFEMSDSVNPVSLAHSRLLLERLPKKYAATRARPAINLKVVPHNNDDLWSFVMLPDARPVSTASLCPSSIPSYSLFALMVPACRG